MSQSLSRCASHLRFITEAMRKRLLQGLLTLAAVSLFASPTFAAVDLSGTVFETVGSRYHIDPKLLYSISLVESAVKADTKSGKEFMVQPSPWTLRTRRKPYYAQSREEAEKLLLKLLQVNKSVDIGLMQINSRWHAHRVKNITDLLDPETNVSVAAAILSELIDRYPDNALEVIARYHSGQPARGTWYAKHVLRVYENVSKEH